MLIDGIEVEFRRMTMGDMVTLSDKLRERNQTLLTSRLAALHAAAGVEGDQLPMVVAELSREPTIPETIRWCYTPAGSRAACVILTGKSEAEVGAWPYALDMAGEVNKSIRDKRTRPEVGAQPLPPSDPSGGATTT